MAEFDYDLIAIGSGPAGLHAVLAAAQAGQRAAIVERSNWIGGVCLNTGTIPSKTLREAALPFTGGRRLLLSEEGYRPPSPISMSRLAQRCEEVIARERDAIVELLRRCGVDLIVGDAQFTGPQSLLIKGEKARSLSAAFVLIATGTRPRRPAGVPFDERQIIDSDGILQLTEVPASLAVLGAGVIGCEYASIFAALGADVTLIDQHPDLLTFADREITAILRSHLRDEYSVHLELGTQITSIEPRDGRVAVHLESPDALQVDCALYCAGRVASTDGLGLELLGLGSSGDSGHLAVDQNYQTALPWLYAAGDVIGFPALASTSMEQGRVAACHALQIACNPVPQHFPFGIYTIPELSMVGSTEEQLIAARTSHAVGRARYRDVARGAIVGDSTGLLKLLFDPATRRLLGVHIFGEGATEIIHLGQAVMNFGGGLDYLRDAVFNYPTLAEAYKLATFDGLESLGR